eukprot:Hpha_TRINITY_DN15422_c0_g5::TRINITY_DN15422_c0_g5_i1::g.176805::m.176805
MSGGMSAEAAAIAAVRDGNALASRGLWKDALVCFSAAAAMRASPTGAPSAVLALARATAALKQGQYSEAVDAARLGSTPAAIAALAAAEKDAADAPQNGPRPLLTPTTLDPSEADLPLDALALYRRGKVLLAAGDGVGARAALSECADCAVGHSGAQKAKREAELGPCFVASSLVEVKEVEGKGLGTVAKQDIAQGTLLLEEKAYATAQGDKNDTALVLNHLLESVHKRMLTEPDTKPLIFALFPSREQSEKDFPHHDIKPEGEDDAPYPPELVKDLNHVWNIMCCNTFRIDSGTGHWDAPEDICSGMFLRASRLNHSCQPSCHYCFKGGKIQVRAVRAIKAGEEATIAYVNVYSRPEWRFQKLKSSYHFECKCCVARDRREPDISLDAVRCDTDGCAGYLTCDRYSVFRCTVCSTAKPAAWGDEYRAHLSRLRNKPGMDNPVKLAAVWKMKAHPRHSGAFGVYTDIIGDAAKRLKSSNEQEVVAARTQAARAAKRGIACLQGSSVEHAAALPLWVRAAMNTNSKIERQALLRRAHQLSSHLYGADDDFEKRFGIARG